MRQVRVSNTCTDARSAGHDEFAFVAYPPDSGWLIEDVKGEVQVMKDISFTPLVTYALVTAVLTGSDERLRPEEIIYSCHLDHPRPNAVSVLSGRQKLKAP